MKLSREQFIQSVETFQEMLEEEQEVLSALGVSSDISDCIFSKWIGNYYDLLTEVCELDRNPLYGNDLDWFCFDTNFGKKKDLAVVEETASGRTWNIKDANMLYTMIMGFKE